MHKAMVNGTILVIIGFLVSCSATQTSSSVLGTESEANIEQVATLAESGLGIKEGDEVTVELYDGDPEEVNSNLLASALSQLKIGII